jgi:hypothetical protein
VAGHRVRNWWWVKPGLWKRGRENLWIELDQEQRVYVLHGFYRDKQAPDVPCARYIAEAMNVADDWMCQRDAELVAPYL